jgi:uncharacterized membrane protein
MSLICGNLRRFVSTPSQDFPRRDLAFRDGSGGFSLTLKRNCSISPAGLLAVFAALSIAALAIGVGFAIAGAWMILPFAGLEVAALGTAFVLYARRAGDYERIELDRGRLTVEVAEEQRTARYELDPRRAEVVVEKQAGYGARVWLMRGAGEEKLELGRHLDAASRLEFAAELTRRLRISPAN